MPTYRVFYAKPQHMRETLTNPQSVTRETVIDTHQPVALLHSCVDADDAYRHMQGEEMTREEANRIGNIAGRTSMSVGDALYALDGTILVCDRVGWITHPPITPNYPEGT